MAVTGTRFRQSVLIALLIAASVAVAVYRYGSAAGPGPASRRPSLPPLADEQTGWDLRAMSDAVLTHAQLPPSVDAKTTIVAWRVEVDDGRGIQVDSAVTLTEYSSSGRTRWLLTCMYHQSGDFPHDDSWHVFLVTDVPVPSQLELDHKPDTAEVLRFMRQQLDMWTSGSRGFRVLRRGGLQAGAGAGRVICNRPRSGSGHCVGMDASLCYDATIPLIHL